MALFGANPSEQEIQAFAANDMQPALPEEADATAYGPRLEQLRTVAQKNQPLVAAAQLAGANGEPPDIGKVAAAWQLTQIQDFLNDPSLSVNEKIQAVTGHSMREFDSAPWGTFNIFDGTIPNNRVNQSWLGEKAARTRDIQSATANRTAATTSNIGVDQARIGALGAQANSSNASAAKYDEQARLVAMQRDVMQKMLNDESIPYDVRANIANGLNAMSKTETFIIKNRKNPDGSPVHAMGRMGPTGPILQETQLEVPPNVPPKTQYEFQARMEEYKRNYPHATPRQILDVVHGDDNTRRMTLRDMKDQELSAQNAQSESEDDGGEIPVATPAPTRAPTSAAMPPNRGGGRSKVSESKKKWLMERAQAAIDRGVPQEQVMRTLRQQLGE
jgi:hypothetical protein